MLSEGNAPNNFKNFLSRISKQLDRLSFGTLGILKYAIQRFIQERGPEAAAGTAFFTIFSFFPLLLVLVFLGSFILERQDVREQITRLMRLTFPISPELITQNIQDLLDERASIGIFAFIGLIWSATGALSILTRNINRAWPSSKPRTFFESRLAAFIILTAMVGLLTISSFSAAILAALRQFSDPLFGRDIFAEVPLLDSLTSFIPLVLGLLIFMGLYRWVPNTHVPWKAAFFAALFAGISWQLITNAFAFYLSFGLAQYTFIYGGLGGTVAFMFWIYLNYLVIFFGSHLSAAITHRSG